jgi:putative ABC transport system permease protein
MRKVAVSSGVFITQRDVEAMAKVAVLGSQAASDLFGEGTDPVGQNIRVNGQQLRVVGVTESKGGSGMSNQDDVIYVPLTTAQKQLLVYLTFPRSQSKRRTRTS